MRRKFYTLEQFCDTALYYKERRILHLTLSKNEHKKQKFRHHTYASVRTKE